MVEKTAAFRQRRAADTRRWRKDSIAGRRFILSRSTASFFDLMERFGGLNDSKPGDRQAIGTAPLQVAAPRAGGVAAGRNCFPALGGVTHKRGHWPNVRSCGEPDRPRWQE